MPNEYCKKHHVKTLNGICPFCEIIPAGVGLEESYPVVLFLESEQDRDELIQAIREVNPNMITRKI